MGLGGAGVKKFSFGICDGAPSTERSSLDCFILVNSANPDEMPPYAVFNGGLYNLNLYSD